MRNGGITIKRLIIFLIRKRLGLKKYETFQFVGQKSETEHYYFTNCEIIKVKPLTSQSRPSTVSLNWLLNDDCLVEKTGF